MRRRHKVAGISLTMILAFATAGLEAWNHLQADREEKADRNQAAWECAVMLCEARGGHWAKDGCVGGR